MSSKTLTEIITYYGRELEVEFTSDKGFDGSREEPSEAPSIEIEKAGIRYTLPFHAPMCPSMVVVDIFDFLSEEDFAKIEELLNEKAADAALEREIDRAEAAEDRKRYGND
jgi:hypothetical protein